MAIYHLLLFLFQASESSAFERFFLPVLLILVTNIAQFFFLRPKSISEIQKQNSEARKLDAETIASYLKTIREIQETNNSIWEKFQNFRKEAEATETILDDTQEKLEDCLKREAPCDECQTVITEALSSLGNVEHFLSGIDEAGELVIEVKTIIGKIKGIK